MKIRLNGLNFAKSLAIVVLISLSSWVDRTDGLPQMLSSSAPSVFYGQTASFTCNGLEMNEMDVIWQYTDGVSIVPIYIDQVLQITSGKYQVSSTQYIFGNISTTLLITNVVAGDTLFSYQCVCNVYRTCSGGKTASKTLTLVAQQSTLSNLILAHISSVFGKGNKIRSCFKCQLVVKGGNVNRF